MAAPVLVASAAIETFCMTFQLVGVKVRLEPEPTDRPLLPEVRAAVTVTLELGAAESATPTVPVNPCITGSEVAFVTMAGVTVVPGVQVTLAGTASLVPQVPWKPNEVLAPTATEPL